MLADGEFIDFDLVEQLTGFALRADCLAVLLRWLK